MKKLISISSLLILIDQLIKIIVSNNILLNDSIIVIKDFFNITYVRNIGAAFSILSGNRLFLILTALIALYLIYRFLIKDNKLNIEHLITYSLLIAGIIGNLIDRIFQGYVIDYLDFKIFGYNFPIFNLADICIVIGCLLLIILTLKEEYYDNKNN